MFRQIHYDQTFFNPGSAGNDSLYRVIFINRNQMAGLENHPVTSYFNINGPLKLGNVEGGVNLSFSNDQVGFIKNTNYKLGYTYRMQHDNGSLGIGILGGISFNTIEGAWIMSDNNDPAIPQGKVERNSLDLDVGVFYTYKDWYAGFSCTHINEPKFTKSESSNFIDSKRKRNYYLTAGYKHTFESQIIFQPAVLILSDLSITNYALSMMVGFKEKFWVGADYRLKNSIGLIIGLDLFESLRIGYSFAYNTGPISKYAGGTHEVMLGYRFAIFFDRGKQKYKSVRYL